MFPPQPLPGLSRNSKPEVIGEISLVSIEGRSWSPAVETFTRAVQTYPWHHVRLQKGA